MNQHNSGFHGYFRLEGARQLLKPFHRGLPSRVEEWEPEVERMARAGYVNQQRGGRTLSEVAGQLREAAARYEASGGEQTDALVQIPYADPPAATARVLRDIAGHVERWKARDKLDPEPDFGFRELRQRFPRLGQYLPIYFGTDGLAWEDEDRTTEEGIEFLVRRAHPNCRLRLVDLLLEVQEAMALFHDEQSCVNFFETGSWSSGDLDWLEFFPLLSRAITDHLREHHATPWPRPAG